MSRRDSRRSPLLLALLLAMQLVVGCGNKKGARQEPLIQLKSTAQPDQAEQGTTRVLVNGTNVTIHHHDGSVTQLSDVDPEETIVVEAPGKVEVVNAQGTSNFDMANTIAPKDPSEDDEDDEEDVKASSRDDQDSDTEDNPEGGADGDEAGGEAQEINSANELNGVPVDFEGGVPGEDTIDAGSPGSSDDTDDLDIDQEAGDTEGTGEIDEEGFEGQTRDQGDDLSQAGVDTT